MIALFKRMLSIHVNQTFGTSLPAKYSSYQPSINQQNIHNECVTLSVNSGMRMKMRSKFPRQRTRKHNKKPNKHHKPNSKNKNPSAKPVVPRKCKLDATSETCASLSASQKFSATSMYFSICPVLNDDLTKSQL